MLVIADLKSQLMASMEKVSGDEVIEAIKIYGFYQNVIWTESS